jgi:asparagine synthase (glutamine-hydrolysing)
MFAIALWDTQNKHLYLARDRFGEKPLYYGWVNDSFVFSSELKSFKKFPGFTNQINREALDQYLRLMYVPAPYSIYENVYKLEPGCLLKINTPIPDCPSYDELTLPVSMKNFQIEQWWSLASVAQIGINNQISNETEAVDLLEKQLVESVHLQSLSDVPLGAFLSGGVDSSLITALMQKQSNKPIKTFTIGFEEKKFDESKHAHAVAEHLGTNHTELFVTSIEAQKVIPSLPTIYDEPFADSSQIPTYLVSKVAKQQVTVALSGDGADELFGGYNRYTQGPGIWEKLAKIPRPLRRGLGYSIGTIPISGWDQIGHSLNYLKFGSQNFAQLGDKAYKIATRLKEMKNLNDIYLNPVTEWPQQVSLVKNMPIVSIEQHNSKFSNDLSCFSEAEYRMMFLDSKTYLSDDILCKVDRASMSVSLETRAPFLDHRVAELSWRLPLQMKINNGQGKCILRDILYKYVPRELIERPKMGFGVPIGQWLRGPLREWAEELLNEQRLEKEGYLNPKPIIEIWRQHLSGKYDYSARLWAILMFQAWLELEAINL